MPSPLTPPVTRLLDTEWALSQIGDADALRDMLLMFQAALAHDLPQISALLQAGDVAAANELLHNLKGIVPIFCHAPLTDEVRTVELLGKTVLKGGSANRVLLSEAYSKLQPSLEQLLAEINAHSVGLL